ncbi:MAG: right-handed parallel beta-helix repeat-containing protein, partial [Nitrososphaeraceae archaeon]
ILLSLSVLICITALIATTHDMRDNTMFGITGMLASADIVNPYLATILQREKLDSQAQSSRLTESAASATEYFSASASLSSGNGSLLSAIDDYLPCVTYDNSTRTINICGGAATLDTVNIVLQNPSLLNNTSEKNWFLNANIQISNGATLFINSTDTNWLKINSTSDDKAFAIMSAGSLVIDKTKISSWNSSSNTETEFASNKIPRSYIVSLWNATGHTNITNSHISNLGFNNTRGTWGISYYSGAGSIVENNTLSSNYRSLHFGQNVSNISVVNNKIDSSVQSGLNMFRPSKIHIANNKIDNNGEHGIACLEDCGFIFIKDNEISGNRRDGINLNQNTSNSILIDNLLYNNKRSGIAVWNSSDNIITRNVINNDKYGITIARNAYNNTISQNTIDKSSVNGLQVQTNSSKNKILENHIWYSGAGGISLSDSKNNDFLKNTVTNNSNYGIRFQNASNNLLAENKVLTNIPYNYYIRSNSTYNIFKDTLFDNSTLRFFDTTASAAIQNTDNKIAATNTKIPSSAYVANTTLFIRPITKNVVIDTLDMVVVPSKEHVNVSSVSKNFGSHSQPKKWTETSSSPRITSKYIIGAFPSNTQIAVKINGTFWNAFTTNSSGHITFLHERDAREGLLVTEFEAQPNNQASVSTIVFFSAIIVAVAAFILVRRSLRKRNNRQH